MTVSRVDRAFWLPMVLNDHYAGRAPTAVQFALGYDDGDSRGCCLFGQSASPWVKVSCSDGRAPVIELQRVVIVGERKNKASQMIAKAIRELRKSGKYIIVSYADTGQGHVGYVYQASNWRYAGCSKPRTDMGGSGHARHPDPQAPRRIRSPKHRYVTVTHKELWKHVKWESLPYPKSGLCTHSPIGHGE